MMRKCLFLGLCLMVLVGRVDAGVITWTFTGDLKTFDPIFTEGWSVRLYEDIGANNDFTVDGYLFGVDDAYTGVEIFLGAGKTVGTVKYGDSFSSPSGSIGLGDSVYTVIFNNAIAANATQYIILDANPFVLPSTDIDGGYNLSSVSGNWQAVPEPATLALFGLGLGTVALVRKRRVDKKA